MNFARFRQIFENNLFKAMDNLAIMMEAKAIEQAPKAIGQLAEHIHSHTEQQSSKIYAIVECTSPYGKYIEEGTGPAVGHEKYLPPKGAMTTWVQRILGGDDKTEEAVRWHIYHYGTLPQPFMAPAKEYGKQRINEALKDGIANAIKELRNELR